LFDDTLKEFSSIRVAKSKLETWKFKYPHTYKDAYASLSVRHVFEPLIRLEMVTWNPLEVSLVDLPCVLFSTNKQEKYN
jgi:GC-rich sequence DNA-binding factor